MSDEREKNPHAVALGNAGGGRPRGSRPTGGRPPGIPNKSTQVLKAYANQYSQEAIDAIVEVLRKARKAIANKDGKLAAEMMHVVMKAADLLLDRAIGKPSQTVNVFEKFDFNKASLADLEHLAARIEQFLPAAAIAAVEADTSGDSSQTTH